jgi:hypothetical protein
MVQATVFDSKKKRLFWFENKFKFRNRSIALSRSEPLTLWEKGGKPIKKLKSLRDHSQTLLRKT